MYVPSSTIMTISKIGSENSCFDISVVRLSIICSAIKPFESPDFNLNSSTPIAFFIDLFLVFLTDMIEQVRSFKLSLEIPNKE